MWKLSPVLLLASVLPACVPPAAAQERRSPTSRSVAVQIAPIHIDMDLKVRIAADDATTQPEQPAPLTDHPTRPPITDAQWAQIRPGLTKEQVTALLGTPDFAMSRITGLVVTLHEGTIPPLPATLPATAPTTQPLTITIPETWGYTAASSAHSLIVQFDDDGTVSAAEKRAISPTTQPTEDTR